MTFDTASVWPPCPDSFNMAAHVLQAGAQHPNKSALLELARDGSVRKDWSYGQLITAVRGTAAGLISAGARPGDHVLMRLGNRADFPITYLAAIAAGLVAVPTSPDLTDAEITAMSAVIQPKLVLQDPRISAPRDHAATVISSDDLRTFHNLPPQPWHMGDPGRPAYIVFTSGTSGAPRAVVHGHRAIWARGMMHDGWYGLKEQDHLMHAGAFNWTFTLGTGLMDPWTKGATALIPAPGTPPDMLGRLLANHEVTLFAAAPGVLRKMLQAHIPPLPDLRHALCAGEKLPEAIRASWKTATGTEIYEAFGMSECSTFLSASPGKPAATGTLGRPQPGRQIALLDETGARSPDGDVGEICVHKSDPGLMLEYFGAPQATAARFRGAWFCTGDLGKRTASGDIAYHGRRDDLMNAGGYRVSPLDVEAAFQGQAGITQVAATDVEIKPGVRVIALFYSAERAVAQSTLEALASRRLARYKHPRVYLFREQLPTSANGKLLRRVLRDTFEASHDQT